MRLRDQTILPNVEPGLHRHVVFDAIVFRRTTGQLIVAGLAQPVVLTWVVAADALARLLSVGASQRVPFFLATLFRGFCFLDGFSCFAFVDALPLFVGCLSSSLGFEPH